MKFCVASYLCKHVGVLNITQQQIDALPNFRMSDRPEPDEFMINWGVDSKIKGASVESGFLWSAHHIDHFLYERSSMGDPEFQKLVMEFDAPICTEKLIADYKYPPSKFSQPRENIDWRGVVLACQNPSDRSILRVGSTAGYYKFIEDACRYYGKDLYVKLHPWNNGEVEKKLKAIAHKYKCRYGKVNMSVLKHCQFVITYNSTFTFDCFRHNTKVVNYAHGYFSRTPSVYYSNGTFPDVVNTNRAFGKKLVDFLFWNYMYNKDMPFNLWIRMFQHAEKQKGIMLLDPDLSYANSLLGKVPLIERKRRS